MVIVGVFKIMIYELLIMNELIIYSCLFPLHFLLISQDTEGLWNEAKHYRFGFFHFLNVYWFGFLRIIPDYWFGFFYFFNQLLV
jgi:hypothetical protein